MRILSGFPGIGKTHYARIYHGMVTDLDSRKHRWGFPERYIKLILEYATIHNGTLLVSTHEKVLDALVDNGIPFKLVFPALSLKEEYLERYRQRGDDPQLLESLDKNWSRYLYQCQNRTGCEKIVLKSGQVLADVDTPWNNCGEGPRPS